MKHKTGYIESPPDERHRPVQQLWGGTSVAEPAQYLDLIRHMDFVDDQGPTNSCVWNALKQQHYIALGEQGVTYRTKLSRLFGYYNTRVQHHAENLDLGTIPRQAWTAAKEFGFCSEALWPFEPKKVNRKPDFDAYAGGIDQKWFNGYYLLWGLTGRDSEVRQAISQGHPVIFGTIIDDKFDDFHGSDTIGIPKSAPIGRHMMCGIAYDSDGLWVVNSWGNFWGGPDPTGKFHNGFFRMGWDWVNWSQATDFWAVRYAKEFTT